MSKSRMGFGVFIWFLMCKSLSGMNSEDFSPGLHKQCVCFGPHAKAGEVSAIPSPPEASCRFDRGAEGRSAVSLGNVVRDQPGQEQSLQVLSWLRACEPNTRMAAETQMVLQPRGFGADGSMVCSSLLCLLSFLLVSAPCEMLCS